MDVNLSKLWEMLKDRGDWRAAVHGVEKKQTQLSNKTITTVTNGISVLKFYVLGVNFLGELDQVMLSVRILYMVRFPCIRAEHTRVQCSCFVMATSPGDSSPDLTVASVLTSGSGEADLSLPSASLWWRAHLSSSLQELCTTVPLPPPAASTPAALAHCFPRERPAHFTLFLLPWVLLMLTIPDPIENLVIKFTYSLAQTAPFRASLVAQW